MVKAYLRYEQSPAFGVISSDNANVLCDNSGSLAICPALNDIMIWNLRQGTAVARWHDEDSHSEVTVIERAPQMLGTAESEIFAAGYADGTIRLWNLVTNECTVTLSGHKSAVACLKFSADGTKLLSGGNDTDIIYWDVIGECGICRLRGHKDQVTWVAYLTNADGVPEYILSSSKDTLLKCWDIKSQHCIETVVGHRSEIWSCELLKSQSVLITGTSDDDIKIFSINKEALGLKLQQHSAPDKVADCGDNMEVDDKSEGFKLVGSLLRTSKARVISIKLDPLGRHFVCQTADKMMEVYQIRSDEELKKKLRRKEKRKQEKGQDADVEVVSGVEDEYVSVRVMRVSAKVRSFDFRPVAEKDQEDSLIMLIGLFNNSLEVLKIKSDHSDISTLCSIDIPGHRHDIRTMALSSDDELLLSAAGNSVKIWNTESSQCIRTLPLGSSTPTCSVFLPGNRHVVIGTKSGSLEIYDTWSSTLLESIAAHAGVVWSIDVRPDKRGIVTGGADKEVKFWDFSAVEDAEYSTTVRKLTLMHMRTLEMPDEVLCVKYSSNQDLIAIALLDCTVKVFYHDTLKFFLSLYGHKLPVLSMDISSDNTMLVTGSADKNIKLWGLDFGDCRRSLFGHQDSVTQVKFVPQTHYFFSASKDKTVKYWDGDKFEQIMKLSGHHAEIWALCVGRWGNFVVSAGKDRSIRFWRKTDEQLFLDEEREKEAEETYEEEWLAKQNQEKDDDNVGKKTAQSVKEGERLCEAISIAESQWEQEATLVNPEPHAILRALNVSAERYVLQVVERIRPSNLNQALWVVPFPQIASLLKVLKIWAEKRWNIELCAQVTAMVLRIHFNQLSTAKTVGSISTKLVITELRAQLKAALDAQRKLIGFNVAGIHVARHLWKSENESAFVDWEQEMSSHRDGIKAITGQPQQGAKGKKRKGGNALIPASS